MSTRNQLSRVSWRQEGKEPDYRFSLANERTFLAWSRTALALLAAGVLLVQFAHRLQPHIVVVAIAFVFAMLAAHLCVIAYVRWRGNEIALRNARPLPATRALLLTAIILGIGALSAGLLLLRVD